jgi:glycosyltransferase involved in cell wall biosynthesis
MADELSLAQRLRRACALGALASLYAAAAWLSRRARRAPPRERSGCMLVLGTFHNPNWIRSHLLPLARSEVGEVVVVCDERTPSLVNVRCECPPRWLQTALTRAGAKLCWSLLLAVRLRPDLYMGYHIFPCGVLALILARVFGRPASYQMTAGPIEIGGGGWRAENRLLHALGAPSALVERLAATVVRELDSVVVRGNGAAAYVRELGYVGNLAVITGSVTPPCDWPDFAARPIDVAFVGRLAAQKRLDRFLAVVAAIVAGRPRTRVVIIGAGPKLTEVRNLVTRLRLESNVEILGQRNDVEALLMQTKVFVLTSETEGLSIAMLEAMAAGAVPVVADVGDLRDRLQSGRDGYLVPADDVAAYASAALLLLSNEEVWRRCSRLAARLAAEHSGSDVIAARWRTHLAAVLERNAPSAQSASASGPIR